MDLLADALRYIQDHPERFERELVAHARLSATALLIAIAIFFPLGIIVSRSRRLGAPISGVVGAARVVPSLAVIFLLYPTFGIGDTTALIALAILAGPPLLINTDAGLRNVDPTILENARGLGMNILQVFARVQLPLALPVVIAGVRSATVEVIASATLAALIGAGGLGTFITSGLTLNDYPLLLVGAIPVTAMALLAEVLLSGVERLVTPPTA